MKGNAVYQCEILSRWETAGGINNADAVRRYPGTWTDATGQPDANLTPDPNLVVFGGWVTDAVMSLLEADSAVTVLWSEEV
jgi:hypothetical protein